MPASGARRPRLLLIAPRFPFTYYTGGEIWMASLIRRLHRDYGYDISLLTFGDKGYEAAQAALALRLERSCLGSVVFLPRHRHPGRGERAEFPIGARRTYSRDAAKAVGRLMENPPDLVHVLSLEVAQYIDFFPKGMPSVLTDLDCSHFDRELSYRCEHRRGALPRALGDWRRTRDFAKRYYPSYGAVTVFCREDARRHRAAVGAAAARVIALGIERRRAAAARAGLEYDVAFAGNYRHYPNEDAAVYLCRKIMPLLRQELPDARLGLFGACPPRRIRDLASPSVRVPGTVDDLKTLLRRAALFVAPLRLGGGTRYKILEAFEAGIPVITTARGAAGLDGSRRAGALVIARTPREFADKALALLKNPARRGELSRRARAFLRARHDLASSARQFHELYGTLAPMR